MSKDLDQQLILDYYHRMTDSEIARIATEDWASFSIEGGRALARLSPGEIVPEGARFKPNVWDHENCALPTFFNERT
jgi:hypothetical protein